MLETQQTQNKQAPTRGKWLNDAEEVLSYLERHGDNPTGAPINSLSRTQFIESTVALLRQARSIIARSGERIKELEQLSSTDELTGLMNRRGILKAFERELGRVNRGQSQGGLLVMIDLDNFKVINDQYGHEAGDAALKVVGKTLASDIRQTDIAARMGGDEFVILFADTTRRNALERAQFLIKKMNNLSFVWNGHEIDIRASLGLKEYKKGSKAEHTFTEADRNMYENKKQIKQLGIRKQNTRMV